MAFQWNLSSYYGFNGQTVFTNGQGGGWEGLVYGIRATDGFWVYGTRQKFSTFFLPLACGSVYAACLQLDLQALMMPQACEGTVAIKDPAIN
jgi:hypothetical protein